MSEPFAMNAFLVLAAFQLPTCTPDEVYRMNHSNADVRCVLPQPPFPRCRGMKVVPCWYPSATGAYVVEQPGSAYRWTGEVR